MRELEVLLIMVLAAVILAALARRVGAPYPVFLALGGALLALVPGAPSFTVPPELALALFIAPVLLDAAYDASPRDLKENWAPLTGLERPHQQLPPALGGSTRAIRWFGRTWPPSVTPQAPPVFRTLCFRCTVVLSTGAASRRPGISNWIRLQVP
jgi:hypothetical protein